MFVLIDETFPGAEGRFPRGRLVALRAWLRIWRETSRRGRRSAGLLEGRRETLPHTLRREWARRSSPSGSPRARNDRARGNDRRHLRRIPGGLQLVPFLEHPVAQVRAAALARDRVRRSRGAGEPGPAGEDPDAELAGAATQAVERVARTSSTHFELLAASRSAGCVARGRRVGASGGPASRPLPARQSGSAGAGGPDLRSPLARALGIERPQQPPGRGFQGQAAARPAGSRGERDRERGPHLQVGARGAW